jgi:hypothetical protein
LLRQPTWWHLFWYPRPWRRAGDVWDRLPWPFRWWRLSVTLVVADLLLIAPFMICMINNLEAIAWLYAVPVFEVARVAFLPLALLALVSLALCARHVLGLGLDVYQRRRVTSILLSQPTAQRSVWKRPEIARILLPPPAQTGAATEPRLPREFAEALAREAAARTDQARAELESAAHEAWAIAAELEALDTEIARLSRDTDPEEAARLDQRLEALGPESEAEDGDRRQMRRLVTEQAGLLAKVAERLEQARGRRAERTEALRALWRRARAEAAPTFTRVEGE